MQIFDTLVVQSRQICVVIIECQVLLINSVLSWTENYITCLSLQQLNWGKLCFNFCCGGSIFHSLLFSSNKHLIQNLHFLYFPPYTCLHNWLIVLYFHLDSLPNGFSSHTEISAALHLFLK